MNQECKRSCYVKCKVQFAALTFSLLAWFAFCSSFLKINMSDKNLQNSQQQNNSGDNSASNDNPVAGSNTVKDPDDWSTGDEPMTGAQRSYLKTLSDEAGEEPDENLTKADASKRINELQQKTGRGLK